jgi:type IV secretory pathway protease TraF
LVVAFNPSIAALLADRAYWSRGVPLLKRILALPGQTVCRSQLAILIDGVAMPVARENDRRGRSLPVWRGYRNIAEGGVFSHELAVRRFPGRTLFRSASGGLDRRARGSALDLRGALIM